jgi:hypothetical protein
MYKDIEIYYYSNIQYSNSENKIDYISSNNINNSFGLSKSADLYDQNGILNGKYVTNSIFYNYSLPIDNISYVRNVQFTILTNYGILSGVFAQFNRTPIPGELIILQPTSLSQYYLGKNVFCSLEVINDPVKTRKISIFIY